MVSVIIPTYNRAGTIKRAAKSVLSQTYSDIELIIVDDCSTDNTREIVGSIEDLRLKYVRLDKNSGACVARNKGIELAKGEYIAFQDSDDEWYSDKLKKQIAAIEHNNADVCFCQRKRYLTSGKRFFIFPQFPRKTGFIPYKVLYEISRVTSSTIFCKRDVAQKTLFDAKVIKGQDYDWTIRAGKEYKFYFLAEPLVNQYIQPDSISLGDQGNQIDRDMAKYFLDKYSHIFSEENDLEYCLLKMLAYYKCLCGEKVGADYRKVHQLSGKVKYLIAAFLDDIGFLKFYIKTRAYWKVGRKMR